MKVCTNTRIRNLQCLCRRCHNLKTEGLVTPTMTPDGEVEWVLADGNVVTTFPQGVVPTPVEVVRKRSKEKRRTLQDQRDERIKRIRSD